MPSRVGERARGAGFNSGRLGIIRASSGSLESNSMEKLIEIICNLLID
jgi:hypothetical protein